MQNITQEFTIGFFDSSGTFSIYVKQDDTNRILKFHLMDTTDEYSSLLNNNNLKVCVREVLPTGTLLPIIPIDSSYIDAANSAVSVPITAEMVREYGIATCDLLFYEEINGDTSLLSTTTFKLVVDKNPVAPQNGQSIDTWTELYIQLVALEARVNAAETTRIQEENTRVSNENTRIANETGRVAAETTRVSAENVRINNENIRQYNETSRQTAEAAREAAEQVREATVQQQVDKAHMWADGMTDSSDQPSATNNAKYYSEQAADKADKAADYVNDAHMWTNGNGSGMGVPSATNNAMFYAGKAMAISGLFNGTKAEWDALPAEDKSKIGTVVLIDF